MVRRCARCNKKLTLQEIAANYNDEWFACFPCWDISDGFLGWAQQADINNQALATMVKED